MTTLPTAEHVDVNGSGLVVGRHALIVALVRGSRGPDGQDADQQLGLDVLGDDQSSLDVRADDVSVLEPVDVVRWVGPTTGVTHQLYWTVGLHVLAA